MATEGFAYKRLRILAEKFGLTLKSTDEEIMIALRKALAGDYVNGVLTKGNGWTFTPAKETRKRIFPEWVKRPEYDESGSGEQIWVDDHKWGEGDNESEDFLFGALKRVILTREGYGTNVSWEVAHKWPPEYLREVSRALSATDCGRGTQSPYRQNEYQELELALEFGSETILKWHSSMHFKGYSDFVSQMYTLWKRWGTLAISEVSEACGEKIRWFVSFAAGSQYDYQTQRYKTMIPEDWDHQRALRAWKRSNWIHAITKIESARMVDIDAMYGRRAVDEAVRANQEIICSIPETLRDLALILVLDKDEIEWLKDPLWNNEKKTNEPKEVIQTAQKIRMKPSKFAVEVKEVIEAAGLKWSQIFSLLYGEETVDGKDNFIPWQDIRRLALENADFIKNWLQEQHFREIAIRVLYMGDSIDWMRAFKVEKEEPAWVLGMACQLGWMPSQVAEKMTALKIKSGDAIRGLGLSFKQIQSVLVPQIGWYNAILWPHEFKDEFMMVPETNRAWAIVFHRFGDEIEWTRRATEEELDAARRWGEEDRCFPSAVFSEIEVLKKAGLTISQIRTERGYKYGGQVCTAEWPIKVAIAKQHRERIFSALQDVRPQCLQLLNENETRNTNWWPQAVDTKEFDAGLAAEAMGREGLSGIQRRRWLADNLGLTWTTKVDAKISWEKSTEIVRANPWLKTALTFVDKEEVILQIAAGRNVSWLKYVASQDEFNRCKAQTGNPKLGQYWRVIEEGWSADIRGWFDKLAAVVGEQVAWDYVGNRQRHDQLFYVDAVLKKLPMETQPLAQILLQVRANFQRFGQAINAFEPDGTVFQSYKEFVKYVDLQKGQIVFPTGSPAELKEKVASMLEAPGVSVSAVREFVRDSKNWALMTGGEDRNAVFQAFRLEFPVEPLASIIRRALGKRGSDLPEDQPQAESPQLLFKKLCQLATEAGLKKGVKDLLVDVPEDIDQEVLRLLREHKVPLGKIYIAEVAPKSDPRGWVCGDWTSCCMQFGSSKNNEYMRRRDMSYFLVSREDRVIAQSVIVAAAGLSRNGDTPQLASARLANLDGIALDNVELAPNYYAEKATVERLYREFWRRYVRTMKVADKVDVIIGKSHNDALPSSQTAKMVWKPLQYMVYSDCFGNSEAYLLVAKKEVKKDKQQAREKE